MRRALLVGLLLSASTAGATGFTDLGNDIGASGEARFAATGSLRLRTEGFDNLDLDRGPTPSGELLFPVPLSDPKSQWLYGADFRLRTDVAAYAPRGTVAVKARFDLLDGYALGARAVGAPLATTTQDTNIPNLRVRRVWAEALLPFGLLAAGRMGNQWGLGMLANGGDCADCNSGDVADRIALVAPALGHVFAAAYDWSSTGPTQVGRDGTRFVSLDPTVSVRSVTFAMLSFRDDLSRTRRRKAGKTTFEYGAYVSHRWQDADLPQQYVPVSSPVPVDASQVIQRGMRATAVDGWARLTTPWLRVEAELAYLNAHIDEGALQPGVLFRTPVESSQWGLAVESEMGAPEDRLGFGLDLGIASGDPAPGFGARAAAGALPPKSGDLDGPQVNPPYDLRSDAFRFSSDYRIDRILFRELIGTVTDAAYVRPHIRYRLLELGPNALDAECFAVASRALYAESTPGRSSALGIEVDPTLRYGGKDGFHAVLEHAVLFPLSGLSNPDLGLTAKPAQLIRLRLAFVF